jgi:hypothetical protein|tara:strand:+ start:40 stop:384 length:345 start_codon:yes stop_codon:yes gene_type:complete
MVVEIVYDFCKVRFFVFFLNSYALCDLKFLTASLTFVLLYYSTTLLRHSTGGYVFAYAILFFSTKLDLADFVSGALYFGYMGIISALFALLTGTIGFEACFWFNKKIFGAIKID